MNIYPAAAYIRHLLSARSTAGHGVHSPFIYDFLTTAVRNKSDGHIVSHVEGLRREMLSDIRRIRVTDMGLGSLTKKGEERRVSDIAGSTALPGREAGLLSRIVSGSAFRVPREGIILELGTSLGISTLAMSLAAPKHKVVTVEGCPVLAEIAASNLERHGAENVTVLNMEFSAALRQLRDEGQKVVFSFIDGNHRGTALTEYAGLIAEMGEEMIVIADDIHLTRDMYRGWKKLVGSGIAPVTMETLRFGILFLIGGLTPGNYRIRC